MDPNLQQPQSPETLPQMPVGTPAMPPMPEMGGGMPQADPGMPPEMPPMPEMGAEMPPMPAEQQEMGSYNPNPVGDGKPYFMGDHALIKFAGGEEGMGPEVFWLVDKKDQTIRPFESEMALDAAFGEDLQIALQNLVVVEPPAVDEENDIQEGVLTGFSILGPEYAIREDGTAKPLDFSNHQLKSRYGKEIDEDNEDKAAQLIERFLDSLASGEEKTKIPKKFINKLKNDKKVVAFYISAMTYGEYTLDDVFADISNRFHNKE